MNVTNAIGAVGIPVAVLVGLTLYFAQQLLNYHDQKRHERRSEQRCRFYKEIS